MWEIGRSTHLPPPTEEGVFSAVCCSLWEQVRDESEELTDCIFLLDDGTRVRGHRGVAAARSSYLASCFQSGMREAKTGEVRVRDCSLPSFRAFLEFLYTSAIRLASESECVVGEELWHLADIAEVEGLKAWLRTSLDAACVASVAEFAMSRDDRDLLDACYQSAAVCLPSISGASLRGVRISVARGLMASYGDPIEAFLFAKRWAEVNSDCDTGDLELLMGGVSFSQMTSSEIASTVAPAGLLPLPLVQSHLSVAKEKEMTLRCTLGVIGEFAFPTAQQVGLSETDGAVCESDGTLAITGEDCAFCVRWKEGLSALVCVSEGGVIKSRTVGRPDSFVPSPELRPRAVAACSTTGDIIIVTIPPPVSSAMSAVPHVSVLRGEGSAGRSSPRLEGDAWSWPLPGADSMPVLSVAVTPDEKIMVCNRTTCVVTAYTKDGASLFSFGSEGAGGHGMLLRPCAIAVSVGGLVYVCDEGSHTVEIFSALGVYVGSFGGRGGEDGKLEKPAGLAVGPRGEVVVCDTGNRRVQVFDSVGGFVQSIYCRESDHGGVGPSVFAKLRGVAVSESARVWVSSSDAKACCVLGPLSDVSRRR